MNCTTFFNNIIALAITVVVMGCTGITVDNNDDTDLINRRDKRDAEIGKLFGDGLSFGDDQGTPNQEPGSAIGVNTYLWQASLDTISFMPLKSVDPFGGVIITNWYNPKNMPGERIKIDIRILDRKLRVDGIKVSVFRQKHEAGRWVDLPIQRTTARKLEDTILTRAREMKVNAGF